MSMSDDELRAVAERYARRASVDPSGDRYSALKPDVWQNMQQRQRAVLRLFARLGWAGVSNLHATEVGCGAGDNLLDLLRLGFAPEHLTGIELLADRHARARHRLPAATSVLLGDAAQAAIAPASQDLVLQFTVFSSLLDDAFQQHLADAMWRWVRPGGGVLWYDFTIDNPRNPDVRGVPLRRVRRLFPEARLWHRRVTLAPPLARLVTRLHPALYTAFNSLPLLRTHLLAWAQKPAAGTPATRTP
jgi:SAM-dependent methyltransferase